MNSTCKNCQRKRIVSIKACSYTAGQAMPPPHINKGKKLCFLQSLPLLLLLMTGHGYSQTVPGWMICWGRNGIVMFSWGTVTLNVHSFFMLILHSSHKVVELLQLASHEIIHLFVLPTHMTQELQPLDKVVFEPLKETYKVHVTKGKQRCK